MTNRYDAAVVGAGVIGLAHAYHLAMRGLRVLVLERHARAQGASVRNFGMLWPIGQPAGDLYRLARRSIDIWRDVLTASGIWHAAEGSLHVAYHDDEAQVLREFAEQAALEQRGCEMLSSTQVLARFPAVVAKGLRGGLFSPTEVTIDPRLTIAALPDWLARAHNVEFAFNTHVIGYEKPRITTLQGEFRADRLLVCTGADFREIAPDAFASCGFIACKLQMMRSQTFGNDFRLGALLAAGLTLRHYKAFARCPSLPALEKRLFAEYPEHTRLGIHVMASQNGAGEIAIGDSHEYGDAIDPFDKPAIDALILDYLRSFVNIPDLRIASRWHGIYVKHPTEPFVVARPRAGLTAIAGVGGMGMTLSFGLAERVVTEELGERT